MADATEGLGSIFDAYDEARGDTADGTWAFGVGMRLLWRDVAVDAVRQDLREVLRLVRETHEPPRALFGDPWAYADEVFERRLVEGQLLLNADPLVTWREVPSSGLQVGALLALLGTVGLLLDGATTDWTLALVLLPAVGGVGACAARAAWSSAVLHVSRTVAATAAGGVIAAATAVQMSLFGLNVSFGTAGTWRMVLVAGACAVLGTLLHRDRPAAATSNGPLDDEAWTARTSGLLRLRDIPDDRVRYLIDEARAHAQEARATITEQFGTPERYAARFAPDLASRGRLRALGLGVLAVAAGILAVDPWSWPPAALTLLLLVRAVQEAVQARRVHRPAN